MRRQWVFVAAVTSCVIVAVTVVAVGVYATRSRVATTPGPPEGFRSGPVHLSAIADTDGLALPRGAEVCRVRASDPAAPFVMFDVPGIAYRGSGPILIASGPNQQAIWSANAGKLCGLDANASVPDVVAEIILQPSLSFTGTHMTCQGWSVTAAGCRATDTSVTLTPRDLAAHCHSADGTVHVCHVSVSNLTIPVPSGGRITAVCTSTIATFIGLDGTETSVSGKGCS